MLKINEMAPFCNLFTTKHLLNRTFTKQHIGVEGNSENLEYLSVERSITG